MGLLDAISPLSRRWRRISKEATERIFRAAGHQARIVGIRGPQEEAEHLAKMYSVRRKSGEWQDFGDISFHLMVSYSPDLAYVILYGLRNAVPDLGYDPVPLVLKALEEMYGFRPSFSELKVDASLHNRAEFSGSNDRARAAARILAREISVVPLRHASGICAIADPTALPFILAALQDFNPRAASILATQPKAWWLTRTGLLRGFFRILFGKDET